jgi:pyrimidine operon attenuation protein / uracil phosphoribosyltransferase
MKNKKKPFNFERLFFSLVNNVLNFLYLSIKFSMKKSIILNSNQLKITVERLACQLIEKHDDFSNTILVGLQPRGKYLCKKIVEILKSEYNIDNLKYGLLDITFYRDDFRRNEKILEPSKTDFILSVENKNIVFIDDVLFTGRTVRAALTAIESFGRPKSIELLILIDRRFSRELPIQPDYKGLQVDVYDNQKVLVEWSDESKNEYAYITTINNHE